MTKGAPITERIPNLRQRRRADGSWRIWWEPSGTAREHGLKPVDLDASKLTWSIRQAKKLNEDASATIAGDAPRAVGPGGRTLSALIHAYRRDPEFTDKKPATRTSYEANLRLIERKWGPQPVSAFSKPIMREWYVTLRSTAGETQAVSLIRTMSILFSFAELKGWRAEDTNPCYRLKMKQPTKRRRVATWAELDALLDASIELDLRVVGTACLMSALQGQRQTDVLEAVKEDFSELTIPLPSGGQRQVWAWRVDRSKRGTLGMMQLHPIVLERIEAQLTDEDFDGPILINPRSGRAYDKFAFSDHFDQVRAKAAETLPSLIGQDQLQFRDLRRTFSVWARAGGASDDDVGDVLGNSAALDPQLQDTYMPPTFETASRAVLSIARPTPSQERKKA